VIPVAEFTKRDMFTAALLQYGLDGVNAEVLRHQDGGIVLKFDGIEFLVSVVQLTGKEFYQSDMCPYPDDESRPCANLESGITGCYECIQDQIREEVCCHEQG
jgi:hypothetical protein